MLSPSVLSGITSWGCFKSCLSLAPGSVTLVRWYAKDNKPPCDPLQPNPPCRRAYADISPEVDPNCPQQCDRYKEKKGILHRIKLRVTEGGTNFGTPFRWLESKSPKKITAEKAAGDETTKALTAPSEVVPMPEERSGVQVSVLGADTAIGQYVALLLKQCPCIKKLRLYEASSSGGCTRTLANVVQDLQHINTNCRIQAFSCECCQLECCLQNSDIVLMLDSAHVNADMSLEDRFAYQAPLVKCYTEAIANECPKAFIIVCATPIDCMVPVVAETLRSTGWYDPAKVMGSLAVPEMRASTLAARALSLEPRYTRVPCVGGTEGLSLVPLFSRAVDFFDFCERSAGQMIQQLRTVDRDILRCEGHCVKASDLSEAHALTGLVTKVASALLCQDIPRVSGFVETNTSQIISPANYLAIDVLLSEQGICHRLDFPPHLSGLEMDLLEQALETVTRNVDISKQWLLKTLTEKPKRGTSKTGAKKDFVHPKKYERLNDCIGFLA